MLLSRRTSQGITTGNNPYSQPQVPCAADEYLGGSFSHRLDRPASKIKPKMIKRLAHSRQIHFLRDKEGNEAKAKRVCQQTVVQLGLEIEILEAEFQM